MISRTCEEFHCLPHQARHELDDDGDHLVEDILIMRSYARAKDIVDRAKSAQDIPDTAMTDLVLEHEAEIIRERMRRRALGE